MALIELKGARAGYSGAEKLHGISLLIPNGALTAIIGPNGGGKSTLLKACSRLLPLSGGELLVDGQNARCVKRADFAKKLSYLPQTRDVPDTSVRNLVLYGRYPYLSYPRVYSKADAAMADAAIEKFGLTALSDKPLRAISGGERQKAYIAMACVQDTRTILMDEPATFLDIRRQMELMETLKNLALSGKAVAAVLHDIPMALKYAHSVAVLDKGALRFVGPPDSGECFAAIRAAFGVTTQRVSDSAGNTHYICSPDV